MHAVAAEIPFQQLVNQIARDTDPEAFEELPTSAPPIMVQDRFIRRAKARNAAVRAFCRAPITAPESPTKRGQR